MNEKKIRRVSGRGVSRKTSRSSARSTSSKTCKPRLDSGQLDWLKGHHDGGTSSQTPKDFETQYYNQPIKFFDGEAGYFRTFEKRKRRDDSGSRFSDGYGSCRYPGCNEIGKCTNADDWHYHDEYDKFVCLHLCPTHKELADFIELIVAPRIRWK